MEKAEMAADMKEEVSSNDLPLSANLQDITVKHFVLDLTSCMTQQVFEGSVILWCLPTQTSEVAETANSKEDPACVQAGEKSSASEQLSSEISSEYSSGGCQIDRVACGEENVDRSLELLGQEGYIGSDNRECVFSVKCLQSLSFSGDCCEVPVKSTHKIESSQRGEIRVSGPVRNCCCNHVSCQRYGSESGAVVDLKDLNSSPNSQDQNPVEKTCAQTRHFSNTDSVECSSSHDFVMVDQNCYNECSESPDSFGRNAADVPHNCLQSKSECGFEKGGSVQELKKESVTQHTTLNNSSYSRCSEVLNQAIDQSGCLKVDLNYDAIFAPAVPSETEAASQCPVSQNRSSVHPHKSSSISDKKGTGHREPFKMILDSYMLDIQRAEGIYLEGGDRLLFEQNPEQFVRQLNRDVASVSKQCHCQMQFIVKEHCVHVFMEGVDSPHHFPHAVQIWYKTPPSGPSLKWTKDQDDHPCVFTPGHFLSNRSLFPSQDFPTALPTWEASVTVDPGLTVLLTGDKDPQVTLTDEGRKKFSFFTHFPMPSSTFAIAVGSWEMQTLQYGSLLDDVVYQDVHKPAIRLFSPARLKEKSLLVLGDYLPHCMLEAQRLLGTYPFHRLDVLIVPACFDSLGMANPSLLFLSQSTLCGDGSMCVRVAHELCHTWFGLVIGPQDWTEEWMTEGFCTYLEDILHAQVSQLGEKTDDFLELRAELHHRVLKAELENTDENLQSLRPNKGQGDPQGSGEETRFLKNGMNVEKKFMQVHYLKGYFLLHALEREVGRGQFLSFLKAYVKRYLCQLVTSQEFLQMFFSTFPDLKHISVESINTDWLDCPGMPKRPMYGADKGKEVTDKENALYTQVQQQLSFVIEVCRRPQRKRRHGGQMRCNQLLSELDQMLTAQLVLLLDRLLEEKLIPRHVLDLLRSSYSHHLDNPEVCHRWCELVIKHRHKKHYPDVQHFLIQHQAMGVYLYGEASISRCPHLLHLARSCFRQLQHDMPESVRDTVSAMLYGT